jgi:outer membrane protein OmpA-like peptidoglycan-associated protein
MKIQRLYGVFVLCLGLLSGCATTELSPDQMRQQFSDLARLERSIADADAADVDLLAPRSFTAARSNLEDGLDAAKSNDVGSANNYARQGLKSIAQANTDAGRARTILDDVLAARAKAYDAGAKTLFPDELKVQEVNLKEVGSLVERNKTEEAKRARPQLKDAYLALELKSVKEGTVQLAEVAVKNAKNGDAEDLAPKIFAKAKEQLALAVSTLNADRTQVDKANAYAKQAIIFADRSAAIAELIKDFKRRKYTTEDIVVWHQNGLSTASSPLELGLQFAEPNEATINTIQAAIDKLKSENNGNAQLAQARADEISRLTQESETKMQSMQERFQEQATASDMAQHEKAMARKKTDDKFAIVQAMFDPRQANVYRVRNDVLLSVHGFAFAPGKSEISTDNFALLDQIKRSIAEFDDSQVIVSGYTDSTGSAKINQALSEQRAANVAKFLTDVGGVDATRVSAVGYGEDKPVANDATPEGRAQNRRIEILIKNQ